MQASQSNTASDLLKPETRQDLKPDSAFHRVFPSPFSTPIQAARKYLERQRGESGEAGARETANAEYGSWGGASNQASREQDRRLERSLYEGHSIEAGFDFDTAQPGFAAEDRAYLVNGNGSEPLYRYAAPGEMLDPDPEVVRGAIFRLARESQLRREALPATGADSGANASTSDSAKAVVGPVPTPDFGEVARRVWSAGSEISFATSHVVTESVAGSEAELEGQASEIHEIQARSNQDRDSGNRVRQEEDAVSNPAKIPLVEAEFVEEGPALAHDACNLLSGLALYSELLGSPGVLSDPHRHYADELKLMAGRSQLLIDRLRLVAAAWQREVVPAPPVSAIAGDSSTQGRSSTTEEAVTKSNEERTNLADLLMRWGSLLSVLAQGTLEIVIGSQATAPIPVGAEALERILVNLIRNARAATVDGGAIRISVAAVGASPTAVVLTIDDSGCGMTETQVLRILGERTELHDPQAASRSADDGRQGLGLRIVRELVAASGGTFAIQSQLGRGTRVEICWPVLASPAVPPQSSLSASAEVPMPADIVEAAKAPVGPDNFSEMQLRAMMRRLHRTKPEERSPLSRKLGNKRAPGAKETDRRFGVVSSRLFHSDNEEARRTSSNRNESAAKGAIAC